MDKHQYLRASELSGRAVVDMDSAEKVGGVERVILDPDARFVAGFHVTRGGHLAGSRMHMTVPASAVHAVGPDALTIHGHRDVPPDVVNSLDSLPNASDLIGRKIVSDQGRVLGAVGDVLIRRDNGQIVGYLLDAGGVMGKLERLVGDKGKHHRQYLRADANLRAGQDLIIAPDDAVVDLDEGAPDGEGEAAEGGASRGRWHDPVHAAPGSGTWTPRRPAGDAAAQSGESRPADGSTEPDRYSL